MSTPTADAFLASTSFITCTNLLLAQVQGLVAEAPHNKVEGMMRLWQKWRTMRGGGIAWERNRELLEWCMARYHDNLGAEWLAPFANDFVPSAPSFDEELEALLAGEEPLMLWFDLSPRSKEMQEVAKESEADVQRCITNSLEALVLEELGLGEATEAGEEFWQGQEEEEKEGTKEKTPNTMAGAATEVAMLVARKALTSGAKGLASPAKKGSPPSWPPGAGSIQHQDTRQAEAVVDTGLEAGVVLKETKGKATVDLAMRQAFKEERRACNKC
ncbi:hypothetical protein C0993_009784 [Termitomyces sp. T159_Od127]|nr:hypothetical protein C0993_009784 [Termitomyces sp. T159_Od127]